MNNCASCNNRIASGISPRLCLGCKEKIVTLLKALSPKQIAGNDGALKTEIEVVKEDIKRAEGE